MTAIVAVGCIIAMVNLIDTAPNQLLIIEYDAIHSLRAKVVYKILDLFASKHNVSLS